VTTNEQQREGAEAEWATVVEEAIEPANLDVEKIEAELCAEMEAERDDGEGAGSDGSCDQDADEPDEPEASEPEIPEVDRLRAEVKEAKDQMLRARAELDNVQKRTRRELIEQREYAAVDILRGVLEVLDNLDMSIEAARQHSGDFDAFLTGVAMIRDQLERLVTDRGATRIPTMGEVFDPHIHEAISTATMEGTEPNTILHEVRRGYRFKERVLRAAQVVVAK
jgi:molecular chaperone GrpE